MEIDEKSYILFNGSIPITFRPAARSFLDIINKLSRVTAMDSLDSVKIGIVFNPFDALSHNLKR